MTSEAHPELVKAARLMAEADVRASASFRTRADLEFVRAHERSPSVPVDRYRSTLQLELREILRSPFSLRVDVRESGDSIESLYFTKARTGLSDSQPLLITWTAPLAQLRHHNVGQIAKIPVPQGVRAFDLVAKGQYGQSGAALQDVRYWVGSGSIRVRDLHEFLEAAGISATPEAAIAPAIPVEVARDTIGLQEIIFETDLNQDQTLRFPMRGHLVIEGAPGSGKTTVALQRIPYLVDQQYDELSVAPSAQYFSEETTIVFVLSEVLEKYLQALLHDLRLLSVTVRPVRLYIAEQVRSRGLARGLRQAGPESAALVLLKCKAGVLGHLREHAGESASAALGRLADDIAREVLTPTGIPGEENLCAVVARGLREVAAVARARSAQLDVWFSWEEVLVDINDWLRSYPEIDTPIRSLRQRTIEGVGGTLSPFALLRGFVDSERAERWAKDVGSTGGGTVQHALDALREWREQLAAARVTRHDFALMAWLSRWQTFTRVEPQPVPGLPAPWMKYRHVVIDEGQDLTEVEMRLLLSVVDDRYRCVTVVGDLMQRLNWPEGLDSWQAGGLVFDGVEGHVGLFRLNYRQTLELGTFAYEFHRRAFKKEPLFDPSERRRGRKPAMFAALGVEEAGRHAAEAISAMLQRWPSATVAVLVEDQHSHDAIHEHLHRALFGVIEVRVSRGPDLARRGVAHVTTIGDVKGLEFDCVVLIEGFNVGALGPAEEAQRLRELYVAITRPCNELAVVAGSRGYDWASLLDVLEPRPPRPKSQ